jgi:hypothetical protein
MQTQTTTNGSGSVNHVARMDANTAAARRKFDAAVELLMAFDPDAETLEQAARAIAKVANKAMKVTGE